MRCLIGSALRLLSASPTRALEAVIPASTRSFPSGPVRTAILPPDPSSTLTPPRSLCIVILAVTASARIISTMFFATAYALRGVSHPLPAAKDADATQQRQKPRLVILEGACVIAIP